MKTKRINFTIEIEDNQLVENQTISLIENSLKVTDLRVLPNTDHLREDKCYQKMRKDNKISKEAMYDYVKNSRNE